MKYLNTSNELYSWQSADASCEVSCESEKVTCTYFWRSMLEFLLCSEKDIQAEVGVAYMRSCSNQSCMYGYKVYECATKYAGVMSVMEMLKNSAT